MALIEALICYILYVVVLLYYQYYIGKCKCFTCAQLGKARSYSGPAGPCGACACASLLRNPKPGFRAPREAARSAPRLAAPRRLAAVALSSVRWWWA